MLVFEGPDNSGKSTIASYISYELNIPTHHFGGPPKTVKEFKDRVAFMFDNYDKYIFDRIPLISERVYSSLRNKDLIGHDENIYLLFKSLKPIIIYCRPPTEVILTGHIGKKHDSLKHLEDIQNNSLNLIRRYDEVMDSEFLPFYWTFDYTKQGHDVFLNEVEQELRKRNQYKEILDDKESHK